MYIIVVILIGLFIIAFIWYPLAVANTVLESTVSTYLSTYYSHLEAYSLFQMVDAFMTSFWRALPALALIGLLIWAVIYAQRKSAEG